MEFKFIVILTVMFSGYFATAQIPEFTKCCSSNETCELEALVDIASVLIFTGYPEIGLPITEPINLKNQKVPLIAGMMDITLHDVNAAGLSQCRFSRFATDVNCLRKYAEVLCKQYVITGTYTLKTKPIYVPFIGDYSGSGNLTIIADDWYFTFDIPIEFVEKQDNHIYLVPNFKAATKVSEIRKKLSVSFDKILLNGKNITKKIVSFINNNWKAVLQTIGQPFHNVSTDYFGFIYSLLYKALPADAVFTNDLKPYLTIADDKCKESNVQC